MGGAAPAAARRSSMLTPSHVVSNLLHLVTQWMSPREVVRGSASNSGQLQLASGFGPSLKVNRHVARSTNGVGPIDSTGKSCVWY